MVAEKVYSSKACIRLINFVHLGLRTQHLPKNEAMFSKYQNPPLHPQSIERCVCVCVNGCIHERAPPLKKTTKLFPL